jgi:hypothetical protein
MKAPIQSSAKCEMRHIIPEMSKTTIHEAVTEKLGYRKLCARWVPKMLKGDHKTQRMGSALKFLMRQAQEGDEFVGSIVTGDVKQGVFTTLLNFALQKVCSGKYACCYELSHFFYLNSKLITAFVRGFFYRFFSDKISF